MENPPKGELIKHIASYFGVEVSYFLAERQKENKKVVSTKAFECLNNLRAHTQKETATMPSMRLRMLIQSS